MKKNLKPILYTITLTAVMTLIMSSFAYADSVTDYQTTIDSVAGKVKTAAEAIIMVSAIFTSLMYMFSFANPSAKEMGKKSLYALICGIIMLVLYQNIAGWISELLQGRPNDPGTLSNAMNVNDKIVTVNGKSVDSK